MIEWKWEGERGRRKEEQVEGKNEEVKEGRRSEERGRG